MAAILIIDNDALLRDALAEAVRDLGHDVHTVASAEAALTWLERAVVDAAFLDLRMPGMQGFEVLRRLRKHPHPPVVTVLTAHAATTNTIDAVRLGAFDHLAKPVRREDMVLVLTNMLASQIAAAAIEPTDPRDAD